MDCYTCRSLSGEKRISPGPIIHEGIYWIVDHGYPTSLKGWLVIVLKRHVEALHELSQEEFAELAQIQYRLAQVMHQGTSIEKEYTMCFAEGEHFHHIHVHFVAISVDLPVEARGPRIFSTLNVDEQYAVPDNEIVASCEEFKRKYQALR
jgi:diadenosine tetraphosphate (Ap4A) HIT family hydrolase